jgi:hypothetical protein
MGSGDTNQMVSLLTRLGDSAATQIPLFILPLGVTLGALVLCWGLTANHIAPLWMTLPLGLGGVGYAVASLTYSQPLDINAAQQTLIGLGADGRMVLLETVDVWEHAPDFHGWDPLGSH